MSRHRESIKFIFRCWTRAFFSFGLAMLVAIFGALLESDALYAGAIMVQLIGLAYILKAEGVLERIKSWDELLEEDIDG